MEHVDHMNNMGNKDNIDKILNNGGRRVRKGERCSALLRAILYCTIGAAHEGGEEEKEVDTVCLAGHRNIPNPYSVTGRKGESCIAMVCAIVIMRRTGGRQQQ